MLKILRAIVFLLVFPFFVSADVLVATQKSTGRHIGSQSGTHVRAGDMIKSAVNNGIPAVDVDERWMTEPQFMEFFDSQYAPDPVTAQAQRLSEIKQQAVELFKGYALYADMRSVIDYKAALRAVPTTAATEMAALPDVPSVKNYQPTWPAKPNL